MTSERWHRVEGLFFEAIEMSEPERSAFLDDACGDDASLRSEVEALIEADEKPTRLGEPPTPGELGEMLVAARPTDSPIGPGTRLGAYRIEERIAAGGMGAVYRAVRSDEEYRQVVAIKVIREDSVGRESLLRFRQERDVLARLTHPNIARLIDAGVEGGGRPYLVMEFIQGEPLDDYCVDRELPIRERLELFRKVCDAVQYAHQNLVVHRDLKPSNILVDEHGIPKLLDFGIAKIFRTDDSTPLPGLTRTGARPMTPDYASPEQVRGEPISTASDVYSLGVVLYELLTGRKPFAGRPPHEMAKAICEEDPPLPSQVVGLMDRDSTLTEGNDQTQATRASSGTRARESVRRLKQALVGDLDRIVLRALQKEIPRRYASAEQLSEDLARYLDGRPVLAQKDSWSYRTQKFLRRHRNAVAAAVLIGLSSLAGVWSVVSSAQTVENQLVEIERLADLTRYADLVEEEGQLWPPVPEKIEALEDWIRRAEELNSRRDLHRSDLEALRARALPYDEPTRQADLATHSLASELEAFRLRRAATQIRIELAEEDPDLLSEMADRFDGEIARLEPLVSERRTWRFEAVEEQWRHDKLAELVFELDRLSDPELGLLSQVRRRLDEASTVAKETLEVPSAEWGAAVTAIADPEVSPLYGGLRIEPQLGLIPIGQSPQSGLWEFYHPMLGSMPERKDDGSFEITEKSGLIFVLIPGGRFRMGARPPEAGDALEDPNIDRYAQPHEKPVIEVSLEPFFLSKYEMTQAQWLLISGDNPSFFQAPHDQLGKIVDMRHPVEMVSWTLARETLQQAGLMLPTEAQWEYAARAGTTTPWFIGAQPQGLDRYGNFADEAAGRASAPWGTLPTSRGYEDGYVVHAPVGSYLPNPWGLYDIVGNVWEWVDDDYGPYLIPGLPGNGLRMLRGTDVRIGRGGSYRDPFISQRSSHRGSGKAEVRQENIGIRPARALAR